MKSEESTFVTSLSISQIRQVLQQPLGGCEIGPLNFDYLDDQIPDFSCVAEKRGLIGGSSAIQIEVFEGEHGCLINIVAIWDSGLARAWSGFSQSVSQSGSKKLAEQVIDALRAADPKMTPFVG